jgi:hypothetical protein
MQYSKHKAPPKTTTGKINGLQDCHPTIPAIHYLRLIASGYEVSAEELTAAGITDEQAQEARSWKIHDASPDLATKKEAVRSRLETPPSESDDELRDLRIRRAALFALRSDAAKAPSKARRFARDIKNQDQAREFEQFLCDLANIRSRTVGNKVDYSEAKSFLKQYSKYFPDTFLQDSALRRLVDEDNARIDRAGIFSQELTESEMAEDSLGHVFDMAHEVRRIWIEPDLRAKDWMIFKLREKYRRSSLIASAPRVDDEPPALNRFEQAMVYLQTIAARTKHCLNPSCNFPYFIAEKKSYKVCPDCRPDYTPQDRWWATKGSELRKKRPHWRKRKEQLAKQRKTKGAKHDKKS